MISTHEHLLVRALVEAPLTNIQDSLNWTMSLVKRLGLTFLHEPIGEYCSDTGNRGVTVVAILNASHLALHIWDEVDPSLLQLDVYSCRPLNTAVVLKSLMGMRPRKVEHRLFDRSISIAELIPN